MNIFAVDLDPQKAARQLCNKHIIKMPTETHQLLNQLGYLNHPCSAWVRESWHNFNWLKEHGLELCAEYQKRYNREHACKIKISNAVSNAPKIGLTPFPRCFSEYKDVLDKTILDTQSAYQEFYNLDKTWAQWPAIDKIPSWWRGNPNNSIDKSFVCGKYTKR